LRQKTQQYKPTDNKGFFDEEDIYQKLTKTGNPLELTSKVINFEMFRNTLESKLLNTAKKNNAGAKP